MKWIILLSQLMIFSTGFCQIATEPPKLIPPSPTAMQFQRYGDYPVSHFTGLPQISIPLYTIKEGDIELPITLDYHASGTRVNDVRGLLGQGWTLNTGGQISRTIQGKPDENYTFKIPALTAQSINCNDLNYKINELKPLFDTYESQYDIYSYNFHGKSGKFIIKEDGLPMLFPYKPLDIYPGINHPGYGPTAQVGSMTVVDEDGTMYQFGNNDENATEYGEFQYNGATISPRTTWHLTSISSGRKPAGIVIKYAPSTVFLETNQTRTQFVLDDAWEVSGCINTDCEGQCHEAIDMLPYTSWNTGNLPMQYQDLGKYYTSVPDEILFSEGRVKFFTHPTTQLLTELHVYDLTNNLVKKIVFDVIPFTPAYHSGVFSRYKLANVQIKDNTNTSVGTYSFNYENENQVNAVPSVYSHAVDFWGFYNGQYQNTSKLPVYSGFLTRLIGFPNYRNLGNANRSPGSL